MRRLVALAALGVAVWGVRGWYSGAFLGPVSDAEARGYFERIVAAAQAKDFDALCQLNGSASNCRFELGRLCPTSYGSGPLPVFPKGEELERVCRESAPPDPPVIVSTRYQPPIRDYVPGRILLVRGVDGRGKPYETEVIVFRDGRQLLATHAVFWSGDKFEELREAGK